MVRVLALPRYTRLGPSSRYRFHDLEGPLRSQGIELTLAPLLGDWYMDYLNGADRLAPGRLVRAYLAQVARAAGSGRFDLLWLEKELLPWVPFPLERLLLGAAPYVVDLDDNHFHRYQAHRSSLVRALLGGKLDRLLAGAAGVTCGNGFLAARSHAAGAPAICEIPTVIDLRRYPAEPRPSPGGRFTVGWIGTAGNARYLELLREVFAVLAAEGELRLVAIGARPDALAGLPAEILPWSEAGEVGALAGIDVGIMPLPDEPFEQGKCGLKLLQYMAAWKPAVASPIGVNRRIVTHGETGFLADGPAEWLEALRRLRDRPELRRVMGRQGRERVARHYTPDAVTARLAGFLRRAAEGRAAAEAPGRPLPLAVPALPDAASRQPEGGL